MSGATCLTCEYTTIPRMLSRSATANDSTVKRNVIATTRTGIPIKGGRFGSFSDMRLAYIIGRRHRDRPSYYAPPATRPRLGKGALVRAAPINHRDGNIQHSKINRELAAVVVPVVQHDRPHYTEPRLAENLPIFQHQTPRSLGLLIRHLLQRLLHIANALFESRLNLFHILRRCRFETSLRDVESILPRKLAKSSRAGRD